MCGRSVIISMALVHENLGVHKEDVMNLIGRIVGLDFPLLVGLRTKLGIVALFLQPIIDFFADGAICAAMPKTCATVQGLAKWLIVAGIYGKR